VTFLSGEFLSKSLMRDYEAFARESTVLSGVPHGIVGELPISSCHRCTLMPRMGSLIAQTSLRSPDCDPVRHARSVTLIALLNINGE